MKTTIFLASAMALSAPALAQTMPVEQAPPAGVPATELPAEPLPPATGAPTEMPADPTADVPSASTQDDTATTGANSATTVAAAIEAEFPAYDEDRDGELTKEQFASWMGELRAAQPDGGVADQSWTEAAFAQADTDSSASVSREELTRFLQG